MTKREAAIITAYTGIVVGDFSDAHAYFEGIMTRPVGTLELAKIKTVDEIKEKATADFMALKVV